MENSNNHVELYDWTPDKMLEIALHNGEDFLKICETLTRIGVASQHEKTLFQSCHLLHKRGRYYLVHFKEMFLLDGKNSDLSVKDIQRRNTIATLLSDWGLLTIVNSDMAEDRASMKQIKVVSYAEKRDWTLVQKYVIGKRGNKSQKETVTHE